MHFWNTAQSLATTFSLSDYLVLSINLCLIAFAQPLVKHIFNPDSEQALSLRIALMRGINLAIIVGYGYYWTVSHNVSNSLFAKGLTIVVIIYFAYLINYILHYVVYRTYGKKRTINGKTTIVETYSTRALNLLSTLLVTGIALVACIQQLGFNDLLEAGGVLGVLGVMIALTQGAWAPDIISGLILLNSDIFEDGDVIELDGQFVGLIYKIKMFHTEILNLTNNHRIMIRNAKLRDFTLHNLSKFASAKGLRECLVFNIGYDVKPERVKKLFAEITQVAASEGIPFEHKFETEQKLLDTGDHALSWGLIYYVKQVELLINTRRDMRLVALKVANDNKISLATPLTHLASITPAPTEATTSTEPLPPPPASL